MTLSPRAGSAVTVLFVCTGNICRSALAERLAAAYLRSRLREAADTVGLSSAGTRAVAGSAMHPDAALVLRGLGGDPDGFVARHLVDTVVERADVVLTMTRGHRRAVLERQPRALARTFTVLEAADLLGRVDRDEVAGTPAERVRSLVAAMAASRRQRQSGDEDDIIDPIGQPVEFQQAVGDVIAATLVPVLERLIVEPFIDSGACQPGDPVTSVA